MFPYSMLKEYYVTFTKKYLMTKWQILNNVSTSSNGYCWLYSYHLHTSKITLFFFIRFLLSTPPVVQDWNLVVSVSRSCLMSVNQGYRTNIRTIVSFVLSMKCNSLLSELVSLHFETRTLQCTNLNIVFFSYI